MLGALREALHVAQSPLSAAARSASSESIPSSPCSSRTVFGPTPGTLQHLEQAVGDLRTQPLVILEPTGLRELGQLRGQRGAGTGDLRRLTALVERRDVVRVALDRIGHAAIRHRLVDDLAEDLEHVADLVEDPRQLRVADHRVAAARHAPWPRHRAILGASNVCGGHPAGGLDVLITLAPMGTWGVAIFSDDLASDVRDDYREHLAAGRSGPEATDLILVDKVEELADSEAAPIVWLALAAAQSRVGRLEDRVRDRAMQIIDTDADLPRWREDPRALGQAPGRAPPPPR